MSNDVSVISFSNRVLSNIAFEINGAAQQVLAPDRPPLASHQRLLVLSALCVAGGRQVKSGVMPLRAG